MRPFHVKNLFIRSWMAAMVMVSLETKGVTVVSIADQDVRPGSVVTVPIRLETDDDVIGVQIDVFYDSLLSLPVTNRLRRRWSLNPVCFPRGTNAWLSIA